jgi:F-type H+-transporting ATPase subunit epsilon
MAETGKLAFELVSPEELVVSENVEMVVCPGALGEFGVLHRHMPMITALKPGIVGICHHGRQMDTRYFVAGGFAEVTGERCTVLAEHPIDVSTIDRGEVEQALRNAREDLADAKTDRARKTAQQQVDLNEAKLRALRR